MRASENSGSQKVPRLPKFPSAPRVLVLLLLAGACPALPAQESPSSSLTVIVPGICAHASAEWLGVGTALGGSARERYVVVYDDDKNRVQRWFGRRLGNYVIEPGPLFDEAHIIRVNPKERGSQQRLAAKLDEIAHKRNVTVIVDMDLGFELGNSWKPQTDWAGGIAATLARKHRQANPHSQATLIGHSAGTEAMLHTADCERSSGPLFDRRFAFSPRTHGRHPKETILVLADGDYCASPSGHGRPDATRTAEQLRDLGYRVAQVAAPGSGSGYSWPNPLNLNPVISVRATAEELTKGILASIHHVRVHDCWEPDRDLLLYVPGLETRASSKSLGNALQTLSQAPANSQGAGFDPASLGAFRRAVSALRESEPTPGIGGISLNAIAVLPLQAQEVDHAEYQAGHSRLCFFLADGRTVPLPAMEPEVVRVSYQVAYVGGKKAELSIGSAPEGAGQGGLPRPGKWPVYYLGNTEGTELGLVMYLADEALGRLAFGSTATVRPVAERVPGFRSLPELFPQGYCKHPGSHRFSGNERVFLHPSLVELDWASDGRSLEFTRTLFSVRFGQAGPAEEAFAAFFVAGFSLIARTDMGAPLGALVPYAHALAVFRWLRNNQIRFLPKELVRIPIPRAYTPKDTLASKPVSLHDVSPRTPTLFFGLCGPERLVRADGSETLVSYHRGFPVQVRRYDGSVLTVLRDGLQNPIALRASGAHEGAFYVDRTNGPVFAENVHIVETADGPSFQTTAKTVVYPGDRPEAITRLILSSFLMEDKAP